MLRAREIVRAKRESAVTMAIEDDGYKSGIESGGEETDTVLPAIEDGEDETDTDLPAIEDGSVGGLFDDENICDEGEQERDTDMVIPVEHERPTVESVQDRALAMVAKVMVPNPVDAQCAESTEAAYQGKED